MPPSPPIHPASLWLGTWSRPPDRPSQVALGAAAVLLALALVPGGPGWLASTLEFASLADFGRRRRFLTVASFVAAFLSLGYVALYLRGGPRAPEAGSYWLQGRALAHGALSWAAQDPAASFRARFLWFASPDRIAGIFPPGFALLLAPAFLVGAPMLTGPLLAAALVLASWFLAREIALEAGETADRAEGIGRIAAGLSIASAALRYHTADVLPYGAVAAEIAASLAFALRARRTGQPRGFGLAGALVGFALATLPPAALTAGSFVLALALTVRPGSPSGRRKALAWTFVCALPGTLLLLAANHAATGRAFTSAASSYFAAVEPHATSNIADTLGLALHRLREHVLDVANFEPLALLAFVPVLHKRRRRAAWLVALFAAVYLVVCAPLGTAGAAPEIGAPLLVGALPVEHALMALGLSCLFARRLAPAVMVALAFALAGFAVHASYEHMRFAISGFGRPRFEPDVLREANVSHGLLFFDDDEGYELASNPVVAASHGSLAARLRGDDHDRLLYDSLGHPPAHRYSIAAAGAAVVSWSPTGTGDVWRFEAEADWPPFRLAGGGAERVESSNPCASDGRVLVLSPASNSEATVTVGLPVPRGIAPGERRVWNVAPRVLQRGGAGTAKLSLVVDPMGPPLAEWTWSDAGPGPACSELPTRHVELGGDRSRAWLVLRATGGPVALDKTTLRPGRAP